MSRKTVSKISSVFVAIATFVWVSGSAFLPVASAQTTDEIIQQLLAQIAQLQAQILALTGGSSSPVSCNFTRSLTIGSTGSDVQCLQRYLNGAGYQVAASGAGSPGNESQYFGSLTKAAVAKWQAANGVAPAVGYFGPISQAKYNSLIASAPTPTPTPSGTPSPTGTSLTASLSGSQPTEGLFGEGFASVPFTNITLTAGTDGDIKVTGLKVMRTGQGNDAAFNGVIALDDNGNRIGDTKTFGSDHQLTLNPTFTVRAGQSRTITLAGDSDADQNAYEGQRVSLTLMGVTTSNNVSVNGIPSNGLTGVTHTVNSTLSIGAVTLTKGSLDPGSSVTKEVGTTGYTFAALKLTAGSNEDVMIKSVSWNQSGSAAASDLANVVIGIDGGSTYPATVSEDGKYFMASLGGGIAIAKGNSKEIYIKGDIVSGSNRGVDFDLYRAADIKVVGSSYGYGILPTFTNSGDSATDDDGTLQTANPNYDAYEVTIGAGSVTIESATADVPSQNVAIGLADQPLGGFKVTVKGEGVSVAQTVFRLNRWEGTGAAANTQDVTNITLVDQNGKVLAGPVDVAASAATVTFTDTITYPVGTTIMTLKGKLGTDYADADQIAASTTPSSDWTTVKGVDTNQTITLSSATYTGSTMTVRSGALAITTLGDPAAQTIVAGVNGFTFANFSFDTTASGEDVRLNSVQVEFNYTTASSEDDLTNCQLWDGSTALNTGTNVVNGDNSGTTADDNTFTFDESLIIPKNTIKTLALKCNVASGGTATDFTLEIPGDADDVVPTGVTSGTTITETYVDTTGQQITISASGSLAIAKGDSTPTATTTWTQVAAGTTNNLINDFIFTASNEEIRVTQFAVELGNASTNTPQDLTKLTFWDGSTQVGETIMGSDNATVTLTGFIVPKDQSKILTIKADVANINVSGTAHPGHHITVEYDGAAADSSGNATRGIGSSSGQTLYANPADIVTTSGGLVIFKSVPTLASASIPSTSLVDGTDKVLFRHKVTAPSTGNGIGLYQFVYQVSTSTNGAIWPGLTNGFYANSFTVYGLDENCSNPVYDNGGRLNSATEGYVGVGSGFTVINFDPVAQGGTNEAIQVAPGTTRCFELRGTITNSGTSSTITTKLMGDLIAIPTSFETNDTWTASNYSFATSAAEVASGTYGAYLSPVLTSRGGATSSFVWSGNSTTTSKPAHYDWVNGYRVNGLPSTGMTGQTLSN
ncbi:MAG: hypothetical protein COU07_03355 [Candidatus Harrisonbacteria bacterium CG10_big_fil_rev_8_21_14_0_10_40_38]|uniref:Peptidoglycan binding-like domain-containing protein n=1 Tax=Candidatus Harrisonbacteria bacterium CG10_big_fil_rev_8_21_14_0_10_40_38 TaxID=1974583 RepID=A0A2H0UR65_9BACT|nr:MAG: hypothetical protein COU07_03355 [Candidatus Harrisonbacteria bacterium CG10_big_fil_rev_8_21_14_0_10_40_38]